MNLCGGCTKPIRWAVTEAGRRMPLDPDLVPAGNVEDTGKVDVSTGEIIVKVLKKNEPGRPGADRYRSHFASCPKARDFRRSR